MDDEREALTTAAVIGGGGAALVLVFGWIWVPWQMVLLFTVGPVAVGVLMAAMLLADAEREGERVANSRVTLLAWAAINGGRCGTDLAAFTTDGEGWELPASPLFHGDLLAVGHRDGVEAGVTCSTASNEEGGISWRTVVLVRLSEERPPGRLRRRELRGLDMPRGVVSVSVAMGGRVLCVGYTGWPDDFVALDDRVDAAVRVAASLQEA